MPVAVTGIRPDRNFFALPNCAKSNCILLDEMRLKQVLRSRPDGTRRNGQKRFCRHPERSPAPNHPGTKAAAMLNGPLCRSGHRWQTVLAVLRTFRHRKLPGASSPRVGPIVFGRGQPPKLGIRRFRPERNWRPDPLAAILPSDRPRRPLKLYSWRLPWTCWTLRLIEAICQTAQAFPSSIRACCRPIRPVRRGFRIIHTRAITVTKPSSRQAADPRNDP